MKVTKRDGREMRRVLSAMVVDTVVCSRISPRWKEPGLFDSPWANMVGSWCIDHFRRYGKPPGAQIQNIYEKWATTTKAPKEMVAGVEEFLGAASIESEGESQNSGYLVDVAGRYFNQIRMRRIIDDAEDLLDGGRVEEADHMLSSSGRIELGTGSLIKPADPDDWENWLMAFNEESTEPLLNYPGVMQSFIGRWMTRDALIGFMGPDKSGKSVYLNDLVVRALRQRRRVALFDTGDMSEAQLRLRLGARVARHPNAKDWRKRIKYPVSVNSDGEVEVELRKFDAPLTARGAFNAVRRLSRDRDRLRICCFPNSSVSIQDLRAKLEDWEREDGWVPDVVVIDYADILAPPPGVRDALEQIDVTWKLMRRLSQEKHCLVVTATQSNAAAYKQDESKVLRRHHFSGRKTKLAHVNGMIGINSSDDGRVDGVSRLNWVVRRDGSNHSEGNFITLAGCWRIYDPVIRVAD